MKALRTLSEAQLKYLQVKQMPEVHQAKAQPAAVEDVKDKVPQKAEVRELRVPNVEEYYPMLGNKDFLDSVDPVYTPKEDVIQV